MEAFEKMDVGSRGFMDRSALRDGWKRWGITDHTTSKKVEELHAKKKAARKEDKLQRKLASEAGDNHKLGTIYKNALKKYNETEGEIRSLEPVVSSLVQASADRTFQQLTGGADGGGEGKVTLEDWMSKLPESLQASIEMQFTEKPYDPNDPEQQFGDPYGMLTKER